VVLGLLVAPSLAGLCLGLAALLAFLARTPLRVVLVDRHRRRDLHRTHLARRVLAVELLAVAALVVGALLTATSSFWWPLAVAVPLVALELWFDTRSRSRRLVPELAGTIGICSVAALIILAGGGANEVAVAAWLILTGRAVTSVPHVRAQIARLHRRPSSPWTLVVADAAAVAAVAVAVALTAGAAIGAVTVVLLVAVEWLLDRTDAPATIIGIRQTVFGLVVVVATAVGLHLG
jgi:hypothetical protein